MALFIRADKVSWSVCERGCSEMLQCKEEEIFYDRSGILYIYTAI